MSSYWSRTLQQRLTRRRALAATGMTAAAAAFLAACGGSDDDGGGTPDTTAGDTSGLLSKVEDSSKNAKPGGAMKWVQGNEPLHFDGQAQGQVQLNIYNGLAYESLVRNKPGVGEPSSYNEVLPNLAESWEFSPDKTTITFKLRQGVKWQNVAPVSGRTFDSSDVIASINRYTAGTGNVAANMNSKNASAPIVSVTAPDASTVVFKLKEPTSFIMQRLANMITGEVGGIYPKEAESGFDPRKQPIGTGAYMLDKFTPSGSIVYKKHPEYWNKQAGFLDSIEIPFISQYTTWLAQLKTGSIYAAPGGNAMVLPEDIIPTKRDVPALNMYSFVRPSNNFTPGFTQRFGWKDLNGKKTPFADVRVRQAMSMAMDRDAYIDAFSNVSKFESEGLPMETFYYTSMGYVPGVTLDPREKDFGENAKYFTRNIEEAKKLLSAAGYANGFEYTNHWPNTPAFGAAFPKQVAVIEQFNQEIGLKVGSDPLDYNLGYLPNYVTKRGQHEGVLLALGAVTSPDPVDYYVWRYYSKSGATSGSIFGDVGSGTGEGDPKVDEFIEKAKLELDSKKQGTILADLQRYLAGMCYTIGSPGNATEFDLAWPAVRDHLTFQQDSRSIFSFYYQWWLDETQAPLKKT
ncbi:MAG TPA: ABC transporter substrate-binding protein [Dehalococcoidia bacterium]|nr:ABC transporter substrate-binding protein [Dehalococcoidia bacterium]